MERHQKKQIIIVLIILAIILSIALPIYFLKFRTAPTCFDGIQNQGEEKIDCGSPCLPCEISEIRDLEILWVRALKTIGQNYDLIARISNSNQNHGSRNISYEFNLYDQSNNLILSEAGTTFILPRSDKYLAKLKVSPDREVAKISLKINEIRWERIKDYEPPIINVYDKKYEAVNEGVIYARASCLIKNSMRRDYDKVDLVWVLFDSQQEPIAVNLLEATNLVAKQERYFVVPWFFEIAGGVAKVEVEPQVGIFEE